MSASCFLCTVGSTSQMPTPAATSTDGFGTCYKCNVHACPRHGERQAQYFRCSDCIHGTTARAALTPPGMSAAGEEADETGEAQIAEEGLAGLIAVAPGTAFSGLRLYDTRLTTPLQVGLRSLWQDPVGTLNRLEAGLHDSVFMAERVVLARALALAPTQSEALADLQSLPTDENGELDVLREVALIQASMLVEHLRRVALVGKEAAPSLRRAEFALGVLSAALAMHGALSVLDSVTGLPGGLRLRPEVVVLSELLRQAVPTDD